MCTHSVDRGEPRSGEPSSQAPRCHGSRAKYVAERCRCALCRAANATYRRQAAEARLVDARPAREHLEQLGAAGVGLRTVAERSGVARSTLQAVVAGQRRLSRTVAAAILGVDDGPPATVIVDATATRQLIDRMAAAGFTRQRQADELGVRGQLLPPGRQAVTLARAEAVAALARRVLGDDPLRPSPLADYELVEERLDGIDQSWRREAACQGMDVGAFFPADGELTEEVRVVCDSCPVAQPCLLLAILTDDEGLWAATTYAQRRQLRETFAA